MSREDVIVIQPLDGIIRLSPYPDTSTSGLDPRFIWSCPNCGNDCYPGLTHGCPTGLKGKP